ncbi:MAG: type II toxin-antitoxin system PemK/MazF family toxin [Rhodopila sp.]|nr:type II toxin-antitoxin system PemK/MazF family toxin [Rhodopila sp.]
MSLPAPRPGLVIGYAYLWAREHHRGIEEGAKDRPCAIVAARQVIEGRDVVTVVPITHTPPEYPEDAVEIPAALKAHLGLDGLPSWIMVTEINDFLWPGPDLRPRPGAHPARFDYGMLPPRFFAHVRDRILQAHLHRKLNRVPRSE